MLSKRPRSVGATTLLGEGETGVGKGPVLKVSGVGASAPGWLGGYPGSPSCPNSFLQPSPPDVPQQQQLCGLVQDGQQGPHQVLHAALVHVLRRQAPRSESSRDCPSWARGDGWACCGGGAC